MKRILLTALAFSALSAAAQTRDVYNYLPGVADRPPDGATGQGVVYTHRTTGVVISIGSVITRPFPVGNTCQQQLVPQGGYQQQAPSALEVGARALLGAAIGSRIGDGRGREIATATGAAIGAATAQPSQPQYTYGAAHQGCATIFEHRAVGYTYTAQYQHIQMQGVSARPMQVGESVEIIIRSVFYAGS